MTTQAKKTPWEIFHIVEPSTPEGKSRWNRIGINAQDTLYRGPPPSPLANLGPPPPALANVTPDVRSPRTIIEPRIFRIGRSPNLAAQRGEATRKRDNEALPRIFRSPSATMPKRISPLIPRSRPGWAAVPPSCGFTHGRGLSHRWPR